MITQCRKFRPIKCWGCGQGHNLRDCPTTNDKQKQEIYQQKREQNTATKQRHSNEANIARSQARNTSKKTKEINLPTQPTTENHELACPTTSLSTNVTNMQRRSDLLYAAVAQHRASMATTRNPTPASDTIPANLPPHNEPYSLISDLVEVCGCHISKYRKTNI
jgi:hypothetical protein